MFPMLEPEDWRRYARQLCRESPAGVVFDYDPALATVFADADPEAPLPDLWPLFRDLARRPVMVIRGARSDILSAAMVEAMRRAAPGLTVTVVDDEGHAPLLWDRPTQDGIEAFLTRLDRTRPQPLRADGPPPPPPPPTARAAAFATAEASGKSALPSARTAT
jgi:pimeloyl-ACP methyl ester carboxylesterase